MKKILICLTVLIMAVTFCSCSEKDTNESIIYRVTFNLNYSGYTDAPPAQNINSGEKVIKPDNPNLNGYLFLGWYKDEECQNIWDFDNDSVQGKITLYAKWRYLDKDFSLLTDAEMENAIDYTMFYKPDNGYVGDLMPYYENGTYYLFYLKDGGDSYNHSIYLVETTDFLSYTDKGEILRSNSNSLSQDNWIGTGSVVKVGSDYYFFYTGHNSKLSIKENIMVAKSQGDIYSFNKISGFSIAPDNTLSQNDFRDPQVVFNESTQCFEMTITANFNGKARIVKYTVSLDLKTKTYDSFLYSDTQDFMNLECSDTFKIGNYWYLTYSAQDDTLWYAKSNYRYTGYGVAQRLEGTMFYAAKHISDGVNTYMVGWARRRSDSSDLSTMAWAGNIVVQKVRQRDDGSLYLGCNYNVFDYYNISRELLIETENATLPNSGYQNLEAFEMYESFCLSGEFTFSGTGDFGLTFGYGGQANNYRHIKIKPSNDKVSFIVSDGNVEVSNVYYSFSQNKKYTFTYIQEGSVGLFSVDGCTSITIRMYGTNNKVGGFFCDGSEVNFSNLKIFTR